ncbi:D-alanyl-D-alanine carboxypeptidase/D-alanyl-D-alanine-endopeptidase [Betaproteobacteria bacterium GR16-43]|nr:D-alanyl-D-alanine carboxypeptidase/D-alanyl-D-alanine-endopeptidase [Betaproteobacteria bacterium GR16-43]
MLPRLLFVVLAAISVPAVAADAPLPQPVAAKAEAAGIPAGAITFVVQRLSDGAPWASRGADRSMQPASTLKLLTSMVALDTLGPAWRARSQLLATAEPKDGVLEGDVVLRGEGDMDLDAAAFERMLAALRASGVRDIRGDFVLDRGYFQPARTDVDVPPFDDTPEFRYNVIPDALLLDSNLMRLELSSDKEGMDARLATQLDRVIVVSSSMALVDRTCEDWEDGWKLPVVSEGANGTLLVTLQGDFPKSCSASTAINVIDRVEFSERLFRELWARHGGRLAGKVRDGSAPANARVVAEHRSRPYSLLLHDINKRSDNPVTRMVFLSLGALNDSPAPTAERSASVVRGWMAAHGIDREGLVLENGSGLSRVERVTPAQLAGVLRVAAASPWAPEFQASLPIVGVDGAFRRRLKDSPAATRARIKTGTLRNAWSIAGYVTDAKGATHVLVAIINDEKAEAKVARGVLDAFIEWVAVSSGPTKR